MKSGVLMTSGAVQYVGWFNWKCKGDRPCIFHFSISSIGLLIWLGLMSANFISGWSD